MPPRRKTRAAAQAEDFEATQPPPAGLFNRIPVECKQLILHFLVADLTNVDKHVGREGRRYLDSRTYGPRPHVTFKDLKPVAGLERHFNAVVKAFHVDLTSFTKEKRINGFGAIIPGIKDVVTSLTCSASDDTLLQRFLPHLPNITAIMVRCSAGKMPTDGGELKTTRYIGGQHRSLRHLHFNLSGNPPDALALLLPSILAQESLHELYVTRVPRGEELSAFLDGLAGLPHLEVLGIETAATSGVALVPRDSTALVDASARLVHLRSITVHGDSAAHMQLLARTPSTVQHISLSWANPGGPYAYHRTPETDSFTRGADFQSLQTLELLSLPLLDSWHQGDFLSSLWKLFDHSSVRRLVVTTTLTGTTSSGSPLANLDPAGLSMSRLEEVVMPARVIASVKSGDEPMPQQTYEADLDRLRLAMEARGISLNTHPPLQRKQYSKQQALLTQQNCTCCMYNAPQPQSGTGKSALKPALAGAKQKQRKGVAKAAAKYEPLVFRDQFVKHLESVEPGDLDGYSAKLDSLGNILDFRKYETELFQLLILGRLLAPGGGYVQDGAPASPFSVLSTAKEPADLNNMKPIVEVFNKLLRRFKYLQQPFEEASVPQLLQYVNKFDAPVTATSVAMRSSASGTSTPDVDSQPPSRVATPLPGQAVAAAIIPRPNQDKIAVALALLVTAGLCNSSVLGSLNKDHLVKDGTSLHFVTTYARAYLQRESLDHFAASLRKGGVSNILEFLPANKRTIGELTTHFKRAGLPNVADFYQQKRSASVAAETLAQFKDMMAGDDSQEEILAFLKEQSKSGSLADTDLITLVWQGVMSQLDTDQEPTALFDAVNKQLKADATLLETFAQSARTEVALINAIQLWAYEHTQAMSIFAKILKQLYADDVVSDAAIIFWHGKASKTQGRSHFLQQSEPLVLFLKQQQEEESDDGDE